ncbi:MAG: tRNA uridine-5-carboxymethylaminomethyl(34) synthesis enzyme MnmG [Candidatus Marinimicrobia bacterium]|nr:tRNA uridine-5-carboxymethylaminomethyl(34) synthesis enzyme MnmG [Candidatus Neomarinimicrobiota bacterium]
MKQTDFDIVVVGGGHAGIEASLASSRLGLKTLLITFSIDSIGRMSCNPAIGGLAKGHLVTEIDALGGEMAKAIDATGIQFRILNRSKGRSVWSPRAQADKIKYSLYMQTLLRSQNNLFILEDCVTSIFVDNSTLVGVFSKIYGAISCKKVILTCGTFLNGLLHIGLDHFSGGRIGEKSALGLTESLIREGLIIGRLKTGTPPRIYKDSINFSNTTAQYGDDNPFPFSFLTNNFLPPNVPCFITKTNPQTHDILCNGLDRSPLYTGIIKGVGPRYCPSIEDKIFRFRDRTSHQIFLEPEWTSADEYYINGFSTSLPLDVQEKAIHSIPGLEKAEIARPGYAVEYDFFPSYQLNSCLETKKIRGLYLAGQINGTSGYEEAASLGLFAGINASLSLKNEPPLVLRRDESYIGVLVDDLITKSPVEPYRMFTSSAEYRLLLRFDNSDVRLSSKGLQIGLTPKTVYDNSIQKKRLLAESIQYLKTHSLSPDQTNQILSIVHQSTISGGVTLFKLLCRPEVHFQNIECFLPPELSKRVGFFRDFGDQIEIESKYEGYIKRNQLLVDSFKSHEGIRIPQDFNYQNISSLTIEAREKLTKFKPETLGQASRISGVSPSDVTSLLILLRK